ncbi:MAG: sigma-70 family RNA polymerase sigma factor [Polyangiaceae bacterium]
MSEQLETLASSTVPQGVTLEIESHRAALMGHCYRMLGSVVDAEDAVQETMVRAWRGVSSFDGRSALRTWLFRIATNVCLDAREERARRLRVVDAAPRGTTNDEFETRPRTHWLEPVPDRTVIPTNADPAERIMLRQSIRLAFVAALQYLPPKQRAALLLTEVLGFSVSDAAETLETTNASINSALQRARATLAARRADETPTPEAVERQIVERYVKAFEAYDTEGLTSLLHHDAVLSMPPYTLWLRGHDDILEWLQGRGKDCRGSRLVPTWACGAPAFGQYRRSPEGRYYAWSLNVIEIEGERVARTTYFLDVETLFPRFGLPLELPAETPIGATTS